MKIAKRSKKPLSPHAGVNALILSVQDVPDDELPAVLNAVQHWHWPRTDLHYWIKPLNRFDNILEEIAKSYRVGGSDGDAIQINEFTPRTKELILAILRFTRLLLENATNRKLYASFDRMNDFLLTMDLDVLEAVLRLIFRRAQQIASNGQIHQAETFNLTPDRVKDLTKGWKSIQQMTGMSIFDLVKDDAQLGTKLSTMQEVSFQFYRKAASPSAGQSKDLPIEPSGEGIAMTPVATPAPRSGRTLARSNTATSGIGASHQQPVTPSTSKQAASSAETDTEGMTTVNLGNVMESGKSATDVLEDATDLYRIPKEERLHLLQRIRCAMSANDLEKRRQMIRIRMLAISVLVLTTSDAQAESSVFMFQPTFIQQAADLVHPNNQVPMSLRTTTLFCLDTVSRIRSRVGEVTASLSVNVNHGTLMSILRKLVTDLHSEKPETTTEYIDALFNFLMHLQTTGFAGNMLLGAGIIPLLVDLVKESPPSRADSVDALIAANRAVSFLDNFTYSFASAAGPFTTANGLQVFVARVNQLVKRGVEQQRNQDASMQVEGGSARSDQDMLSFPESTLLKSLFRCLQRLMGSGGNAEGVRNLIDSSLVESCRMVMQNRKTFGPQNMALAINIMLTFVHNEPTSLTILQENKIPDAFYDAIEGEIEPSLDVLSAIPTAIGALCLNEAGLKQFLDTRLGIIKKFFDVFQSEPHARVLNERENAVVIGANFDELVRHHPDLKQSVFDAVTEILKSLYEKGKDYVPESSEGYRLVQVAGGEGVAVAPQETLDHARSAEAASIMGDVSMSDTPATGAAQAGSAEQAEDAVEAKKEDNKMLTFIAVTGRFLEGFFSTPSHCKDYIKRDGLDHLLQLFTLPCIPFDLSHHSPYPGLTTVFLTINENGSQALLKALLGQVKSSLVDIKDFWKNEDVEDRPMDIQQIDRKLQEMLEPQTHEALSAANVLFRGIVKAQLVITILSELYSLETYVSRQPSTQLLSTLRSSEELKAIHDMCALHRACVLTNVKLKASMPASAKPASPFSAAGEKSAETAVEPSIGSTETVTAASEGGSTSQLDAAGARSSEQKQDWSDGKLKNAKSIKTVLSSIPDSLRYFFQGIMTVQTARRSNVDSQQRRDATYVANAIATGMAQSLRWPAAEDSSNNFDYAVVMVKFMADLLQSDRSSTAGLHLIFLKALDKQNGMERLVDLHHRYFEEASRLTEIPEAERDDSAKLRLIHAIGGLKVVLGVVQSLTSHKSLLPPGHLLMLTQDKQSSSYFDPHNFLVKLRSKFLPPILQIWRSDLLGPCPPIIVRAVFRILLQILEGQGESSPSETAAGLPAFMSATAESRARVVPAAALVSTLIDMGFPRSACENALTRRNNNLQAAADWLMSHPEVVAAARTREAAEAARTDAEAADGAVPPPAVGDAADGPANTLEVPAGDGVARPATPGDVDMTDSASGRNTPNPPIADEPASSTSTAAVDKGKSSSKKYSREELSTQREAAKATFISRALALSQYHGELVFDIRDALKTVEFPAASSVFDYSRGLDGILLELTDILDYGVPKIPEQEGESKNVAARVRLVALIFSDPAFRRAADAAYGKAMNAVTVLVEDYNKQKYEADQRPKWLSPAMLLAELIITKSEAPADSDIASTGEAASSGAHLPVSRGPHYTSERLALYDLCLDVLRKGIKERDTYQSCMRLLLLLTKSYGTASRFVQDDGLSLLLNAYDSNRKDQDSYQQYAIMILRNAVEDQAIVRALTEKHIDGWLSKPRRSQDAATFARDLAATAGRDTSLFLEVLEDMVRLGPNDMIVRKKDSRPSESESAQDKPGGESSTATKEDGNKEAGMQIDDLSKSLPSLASPPQDIETVMHYLLGEAMTVSAAVIASTQAVISASSEIVPNPGAESATGATVPAPSETFAQNGVSTAPEAAESSTTKEATVSQSLKDYTYSSFLLKAIGELTASYAPCKLALLSYNKRKQDGSTQPAALAAATPANKAGKQKSAFLSYVISELLPTGALVMGKTLESRKRFALSTQAIGLVINLCNDPVRRAADKEESSPDITLVRKAVLDAIAKAYKESASSKEPMNAKYGRIAGLSHLCSRLLAPPVPTGGPGSQKTSSELSLQMAKLMLEKNFAVILTNALADVDLNYPAVQNLINAILSPLEHLTKLVTKIGKPIDRPAAASIAATEAIVPIADDFDVVDDGESEGDESMHDHMDEDDIEEEIDPDQAEEGEGADVFRNSALGMFGGELEPAMADDQYSGDDMDEQMEEWDDQGEEMMEEEIVPSDVSDTSEGEDDDMEMAGEIRDALDDQDDDMGSSDDDSESDEDDDGQDDEDRDVDDDGDDGPVDLQADITAALQNGQLEPVDDFEGRLINEGMDLLGEAGEDGMIQIGGAVPWGAGLPEPQGEDDDDLEGGGEAPEGDFVDDGDDQDLDDDDNDDDDGPPGTFDVNEMFRDLVGGGGQGAANVQLAIMGGPPGEEQPILSVDLGANPSGLGGLTARRTGLPTSSRAANAGPVGQHSLLVDETDTGRHRSRGEFAGSSRSSRRAGRHGTEYQEWLSSIEDMIGSGAGQLLEQVFGNIQGGAVGHGLPPPMPAGGMGGAGAMLQNLLSSMGNRHVSRHRSSNHHSRTEDAAGNELQVVNETIANPGWIPSSTLERWTECFTIFNPGMQPTERIQLYAKRITAVLTPEKQRRQREQDEKDAKEKAERIKVMEEQAAKEEEEAAQRERERQEAAAAEAATIDSAEAAPVNSENSAEVADSTMDLDTAPLAAPEITSEQANGSSAAQAGGSSERPNWRERVARRRQEQATAAASQQAASVAADADELARVLALANSFAAGLPAASAEVSTQSNEEPAPASVAMASEPAPAAPEDVAIAATEDTEMAGEPADDEAMEPTEAEPEAEEEEAPEAGPSAAAAPAERVTIQIRGNMVDITDTGIDPTFLEALPDDMREEVLNQHFRESRAAAAVASVPQDVSTTISSEFLDALPPEMRAEVLAQEALERARRAQQQQQQQAAAAAAAQAAGNEGEAPADGENQPVAPGTSTAGAAAAAPGAAAGAGGMMDLDPAAFLASLDPQLRETVLLEQGEEMLDILPPDLRAEYETILARERRAMAGVVRRPLGGRGAAAPGYTSIFGGPARPRGTLIPPAGAVPIKREAVQLLDKSGVATLIRLLFFPPPLKKMALQSILIHLCENTKTRIDLLNLLLTILHDGTKDGGAGGAVVDKTFSQMSLSRVGAGSKPTSKGKGSTGPQAPTTPSVGAAGIPATPSIPGLPFSLVSGGPGDNIPNLVVQRSLEALAYLVASNEASAVFFLTEQELQLNLGKDGSKKAPGTGKRDKGKGRASEAAPQQSTKVYPIIILLSLLDRESLTRTSSIMEALTKLLAHITIPLRTLEQNQKRLEDEKKANEKPVSGGQPEASIKDEANPPSATAAPKDTPVAKAVEENRMLVKAPQIPTNYLKMVVNILDLGECSAKMFSAALGLINNIWLLPEARKTVSTELIGLAQKYGKNLITDLAELESALDGPPGSDMVVEDGADQSATLSKFSQASSNQAKILRVLKTIEHAKQQQAKLQKKRKDELEVKAKAEETKKLFDAAQKKKGSAEMDTAEGPAGAGQSEQPSAEAEPNKPEAVAEAEEEEEDRNKVDELYDGFDFSPLWTKLSDCLTVIEKSEDVSNAGTLLPLIEAFLLVSSWGIEGTDALSQETPAMLPANMLSPVVQPAII